MTAYREDIARLKSLAKEFERAHDSVCGTSWRRDAIDATGKPYMKDDEALLALLEFIYQLPEAP